MRSRSSDATFGTPYVGDGGLVRLRIAPSILLVEIRNLDFWWERGNCCMQLESIRTTVDDALLGIRQKAIDSKLTLDIAIEDGVEYLRYDEQTLREVVTGFLDVQVRLALKGDTVRLTLWQDGSDLEVLIDTLSGGVQLSATIPHKPSLRH